jgi:cell division protein FtsQ
VDGLRGTNILAANLAAYRQRLRDSPWIGDVAIRRLLPSTVEVFVSERTPIGLCRLGSQLHLFDRHGIVIAEFGPKYSEFDLPIVDGLHPRAAGGPPIDPARAELAARIIDALAPHKELARQLSQIDVTDAHDAVVLLDRDGVQLHVGEDRFLERIQGYVDVAAALRERVRDIEYVDLRFDERLYVRPVARAARGGEREPVATAGRKF